jgi:hypothetical protein
MNSRLALSALLLTGVLFTGCGDDDSDPNDRDDAGPDAAPPDDTRDSGPDDPGPMDGGRDASRSEDSGEPNPDADVDPGDDDAGGSYEIFEVPAGGGAFAYTTPSGATIMFDFPASAAGIDITLMPIHPDDLDWDHEDVAGAISEVIELGPDGLEFDDPVEVVISGGALLAFTYSELDGVPEPLELNGDGDALLLTHFSYLAIVAPNQSCQSESGWNDEADSQRCTSAGSATTYRHYGCKNYQFCYTIEAGCCVEPGDADVDCKLGDAELALVYNRTDSNGGAYPYCDVGLPAAAPYVMDYAPDMLSATGADQVITLTGTGFEPNGSVFTNSDGLIATTFVSATEVTATVPGAQLNAAGSLNNVGYVNPSSSATGACAPGSAANCDWINRSNLVNIPVAAVVVIPMVTSIAPTMLIASGAMQVITLTGTSFDPDGSVFITNVDGLITTSWVSATEVTATVPGTQLATAGMLDDVGFVNPTAAAAGACAAANTGNCDWTNRSNAIDVPIVAPAGNPTVTSIAPTMLIANSADQMITLTGTNFDPDGSAFTNLDGLITTTWVSATEVTATVPGAELAAAGTLNDVGFVNPTAAASGACAVANPGNCDWGNRSNTIDIPIQ